MGQVNTPKRSKPPSIITNAGVKQQMADDTVLVIPIFISVFFIIHL